MISGGLAIKDAIFGSFWNIGAELISKPKKFIKSIFSNDDNKKGFLNTKGNDKVTGLLGEDMGSVSITSDVKPDIIKSKSKDKPLMLNNDVTFDIVYYDNNYCKNTYKLKFEKGYKWDGATIPESLQWLLGSNVSPEFLVASMVHDKMCEDHSKINYNRNLSSNIFKTLLKQNGTSPIKAELMSWCVDCYQSVFSDWDNNYNYPVYV